MRPAGWTQPAGRGVRDQSHSGTNMSNSNKLAQVPLPPRPDSWPWCRTVTTRGAIRAGADTTSPGARTIALSGGAGAMPTRPGRGDRMLRALMITGLSDRERIMLAALAYHDGTGGAFPGHDRLGEIVGVKRRQVVNILARLRRKGRVSWRRRGRQSAGSKRVPYRVRRCLPMCNQGVHFGNCGPMCNFGLFEVQRRVAHEHCNQGRRFAARPRGGESPRLVRPAGSLSWGRVRGAGGGVSAVRLEAAGVRGENGGAASRGYRDIGKAERAVSTTLRPDERAECTITS